MAVIGANVLTLSDLAKRQENGKIAPIVEMLGQTNEMLDDMLFQQGNLETGHRTTMRTGLPAVAWRLLNQGVIPSKSGTAQVDEATAMLEAWSEVDVELARLSGDVSGFRLSEAGAFVEAMNQEMQQTLWYGNPLSAAEEFLGLSPRYSSLSAQNAQNIVDAGGTGSDNMSIWLIVWGPNSIFGIYPKGSMAGLDHEDLGIETAEMTAGIGGARMRVYRDLWSWKTGIALRDWRFVVRIANIDVSNLVTNTTPADILQLMAKATYRVPSLQMGRAVFYANRTLMEYLDIQAQNAVKAGGQLGYNDVAGRRILNFRGIPIKISDALLTSEARVV